MPADLKLLTPADRKLLASQPPGPHLHVMIRLLAIQAIEAAPKGTKNQVTRNWADLLGCSTSFVCNLAVHFRKHGLTALVPKGKISQTAPLKS